MKKISKNYFPATVVNARLSESINVFFESMEDFFKKQNWNWVQYTRTGDKWTQEDFTVEIKGRYSDGAFRDILFSVRRLPGIIGQSTRIDHMAIGYDHKFYIYLPREYPANLSHIKMRAATRLWHPRISMGSSGDACITVNGELDRILIDLIYHLLMDPRRIRPPKLFPKEDSGMNAIAMRWFEKDAENIHKTMLTNWDAKHEKTSVASGGGIRIIGGQQGKIEPDQNKTPVRLVQHEEELEKDEPKEKKKGVRII